MRLIDADAMYADIVEKGQASKRYKLGEVWELNCAEIKNVIDNQPTVDVAPIRRGKWIDDNCSECGQYVYSGDMRNYCPCCGARLEEE